MGSISKIVKTWQRALPEICLIKTYMSGALWPTDLPGRLSRDCWRPARLAEGSPSTRAIIGLVCL